MVGRRDSWLECQRLARRVRLRSWNCMPTGLHSRIDLRGHCLGFPPPSASRFSVRNKRGFSASDFLALSRQLCTRRNWTPATRICRNRDPSQGKFVSALIALLQNELNLPSKDCRLWSQFLWDRPDRRRAGCSTNSANPRSGAFQTWIRIRIQEREHH